jgi:hypothetical protein
MPRLGVVKLAVATIVTSCDCVPVTRRALKLRAVAQALDGELERHAGPPGAEKRSVQGVQVPAVYRPAGSHDCLGEEQSAEQALGACPRAGASLRHGRAARSSPRLRRDRRASALRTVQRRNG